MSFGARYRTAQLPAADQPQDSHQAVQQMPSLIDPDRRGTVQRCRHRVEHGAIVIQVPPVQRGLVAEKRQVIVKDKISVPIVDVLVPRDSVVAERGQDEGDADQHDTQREPIPDCFRVGLLRHRRSIGEPLRGDGFNSEPGCQNGHAPVLGGSSRSRLSGNGLVNAFSNTPFASREPSRVRLVTWWL